uniref:EF-hand domain-containing protein n=1 Tax=Timema douglasi TaxID=61478 RepID=A0A7R8VSU9_TIMDO|nr:unnamed protein product [Timema douglasi]
MKILTVENVHSNRIRCCKDYFRPQTHAALPIQSFLLALALLNRKPLFDSNRKGEMTLPDATQALLHSTSMSPEDVHSMFTKIDTNLRGYITFEVREVAGVGRSGVWLGPAKEVVALGAGRIGGTKQSSVKSRGEWWGAGEGGIESLDVGLKHNTLPLVDTRLFPEGDVASKVLRQRLMHGLLAALLFGPVGSLGESCPQLCEPLAGSKAIKGADAGSRRIWCGLQLSSEYLPSVDIRVAYPVHRTYIFIYFVGSFSFGDETGVELHGSIGYVFGLHKDLITTFELGRFLPSSLHIALLVLLLVAPRFSCLCWAPWMGSSMSLRSFRASCPCWSGNLHSPGQRKVGSISFIAHTKARHSCSLLWCRCLAGASFALAWLIVCSPHPGYPDEELLKARYHWHWFANNDVSGASGSTDGSLGCEDDPVGVQDVHQFVSVGRRDIVVDIS